MINNPLSRRQIAAALTAAVLLIGLIGWHIYAGQSRPDIAVHPGMYDLRQEMQRTAGQPAPEGTR